MSLKWTNLSKSTNPTAAHIFVANPRQESSKIINDFVSNISLDVTDVICRHIDLMKAANLNSSEIYDCIMTAIACVIAILSKRIHMPLYIAVKFIEEGFKDEAYNTIERRK